MRGVRDSPQAAEGYLSVSSPKGASLLYLAQAAYREASAKRSSLVSDVSLSEAKPSSSSVQSN